MPKEKRGKVNKVERKEALLNRIHLFATKHKDDPGAAEALMSFFRGECIHIPDKDGKCELCGTHRIQN